MLTAGLHYWPINQAVMLPIYLEDPDTGLPLADQGVNISFRALRFSDGRYWTLSAEWSPTPDDIPAEEITEMPGLYLCSLPPEANAEADRYYIQAHWQSGGDERRFNAVVVSGSLGGGGGGPSEGAHQLTFIVRNSQDSEPVTTGAVIDVFNADETVHFTRLVDADRDGTIILNIDPGNYVFRAQAPWFTVEQASYPMSVATDITVPIDGVLAQPPTSGDPQLCTVYGFALDAAGQPLDGVEIAFLGRAPLGIGDNVITGDAHVVATATHEEHGPGYFEVDLVRGAEVRLRSTAANLRDLVVRVPSAASASLAELIERYK